MIYALQRHPLVIDAYFRHSLVLTYAFARGVLQELLPPGLVVDGLGEWGFVAVAMVQTQGLRPAFMPKALGQDFCLVGYRVFSKFKCEGRTLRGLRILRSDANRRKMVIGGNLLTHYNYHLCQTRIEEIGGQLSVEVRTPDGAGDLMVTARVDETNERLPGDSVFKDLHEARRYAGPLPFTFDYERRTHSMIVIKGVRENWQPRVVSVDVKEARFLESKLFGGAKGRLCSAFYVHDIPYRWERGVRYRLPEAI
jgi:hypothetical protein